MTLADGFAGDPRRPNIVVILADDQSWDDSDFTGQMSVNTPD